MFGFLRRAALRFEVSRIDLRPGDVLVVRTKRPITGEQARWIRDNVRLMAGDYRVLVLDGDLDLAVMTAPNSNDEAAA